MDDQLEKPAPYQPLPTTAVSGVDGEKRPDDEDQSSDDEDGGPDWTKLSAVLASSVSRPVIPKRGEKDHEPAEGGETRLQSHVLGRARAAMFDALRAERGTSSKSMSHAIWYPNLARAHVTVARGVHFTSLGHSVARPQETTRGELPPGAKAPSPRRLELLPEEALYLVERGALSCYLPIPQLLDNPEDGIPMSVQQVYDEMIGREGLTLEKYQVYAYLKRLGYAVTRAKAPSLDYPTPLQSMDRGFSLTTPLASRISGLLFRPCRVLAAAASSLLRLLGFGPRIDWWRPWSCLHQREVNTSQSMFKYLRLLVQPDPSVPVAGITPLHAAPDQERSPYEVFFNLYKPVTPFRKTAPPEPDFQVVVVNARTTPMPTLHELDALFNHLPELPPLAPRKKPPLPAQPKVDKQKGNRAEGVASGPKKSVSFNLSGTPGHVPPGHVPPTPPGPSVTPTVPSNSLWKGLLSFWSSPTAADRSTGQNRPPPRPNPFPALKQGKKMVVIAVVDAGSVGFFRFGQGTFEEWPMA